MRTEFMSVRLESALRWAADCHASQTRRITGVPYFEHAAAVALVLAGAGFEEDVIVAGLLHDVVEDTGTSLNEVTARFGPVVAEMVAHCTEVKTDARGQKRPWTDRKRDHVEAMADAPLAARAIMLADKLHNLISIEVDLRAGRPVWSQFHAERDQLIRYYQAAIDACGHGDPRLEQLATQCRVVLARVQLLA
jgi:(p)ppGpp synthase/HD superfamily hydrolase